MNRPVGVCNICGGSEFQDFRGRAMVQCKGCGSLERGRMMALHLETMSLPQGARVLHIAPEEAIWKLLRARPEIADYVVADYNPDLYTFVTCRRIDLCNLADWPANQFDLILHSHVLEHTRCNIAYTLFHLHRMLTPAGRHMFIVPFTVGSYDESFQKMTGEERTRRFGQWDHLRRFGVDDIGDHLGRILRLPPPEAVDAELRFGRRALEAANIPENHWHGYNASTMLNVGKRDYLLA
jgi:phosphoglycolate phosphatase